MICNCPKCSYTSAHTVNEFASNNGLPLSPTEFECVNMDGKIIVLDSKTIPAGTLIDYGDKREAFRAFAFDEYDKPWVSYTNLRMMRGRSNPPKIVYWGL